MGNSNIGAILTTAGIAIATGVAIGASVACCGQSEEIAPTDYNTVVFQEKRGSVEYGVLSGQRSEPILGFNISYEDRKYLVNGRQVPQDEFMRRIGSP